MSECAEQCVAEDNAQERAGEQKGPVEEASRIGATLVRVDGAQKQLSYFPAIEQPADWLFCYFGTSARRSQCCCCYSVSSPTN